MNGSKNPGRSTWEMARARQRDPNWTEEDRDEKVTRLAHEWTLDLRKHFHAKKLMAYDCAAFAIAIEKFSPHLVQGLRKHWKYDLFDDESRYWDDEGVTIDDEEGDF